MPNTFSGLARDIFTTEFDSQTGITTFSQISGWFSVNIGSLNTLLHTSFEGVDPDIDAEAGSIYRDLYMVNFYNRQTRNALRGVMVGGSDVLSFRDGDEAVTFVNKKEVAKEYKALANDYQASIDKKVFSYCLYGAYPRQAIGLDTYSTGTGYYPPGYLY